MAVRVAVRSYTHCVTYIADNVLRSLKEIIRQSGLDPAELAESWEVLHRGLKAWIESGHLEKVVLEVYAPTTGALVGRWDVEIVYAYTDGTGAFWTDTDAIRFYIQKAGVYPGSCRYDVKVVTRHGSPRVDGWSSTTFRSTAGFVQQSIGTAVDASGLGGGFSYYRKV